MKNLCIATLAVIMIASFTATASAQWWNPWAAAEDRPATPPPDAVTDRSRRPQPPPDVVTPAKSPTGIDTVEVAGKDFYSIGSMGGSQQYVLKVTDTKGRIFRFDGEKVTATIAATVNIGDVLEVEGNEFKVLDRLRQVVPTTPIFMKYVEGVVEYHPASLASRGVLATIVADYSPDASIPEVSEEVLVEVVGIDEPGFNKFLENIQAAGAWVRLPPVGKAGGGPSNRFAVAVAAAWGSPINDFPRVVRDALGRRVLQTVWPAGISVVSLRRYDITEFPRQPARGTISPDGIINPGDVGPLDQARKFRGHKVYTAVSIDDRLAATKQQAAARRQAVKKALVESAKAVIDQALAPPVQYPDDPYLGKLRNALETLQKHSPADTTYIKKANDAIQKRVGEIQAEEVAAAGARADEIRARREAERADRQATAIQDAVKRVEYAVGQKKLTAEEAADVENAVAFLRGLSADERPGNYPSLSDLAKAAEKVRKAKN